MGHCIDYVVVPHSGNPNPNPDLFQRNSCDSFQIFFFVRDNSNPNFVG